MNSLPHFGSIYMSRFYSISSYQLLRSSGFLSTHSPLRHKRFPVKPAACCCLLPAAAAAAAAATAADAAVLAADAAAAGASGSLKDTTKHEGYHRYI
jgi:hypothetical protein